LDVNRADRKSCEPVRHRMERPTDSEKAGSLPDLAARFEATPEQLAGVSTVLETSEVVPQEPANGDQSAIEASSENGLHAASSRVDDPPRGQR